MDRKRQKNQLELAFTSEHQGEAPKPDGEGTERSAAKHDAESPAATEHLMEEICRRENLKKALRNVRANRGSPGVGGMTVDELPGYLTEHWPAIRAQLLEGTYRPQPVKRVDRGEIGNSIDPQRAEMTLEGGDVAFRPVVE